MSTNSEFPKKELLDLQYALDEAAIVAYTDEKGIIRQVNDKFCKVSQYTRDELIGSTHRIVNSNYHSQEFFKEMWGTISAGEVWKGEIRNRAKDGSIYWVDTTIVPFLNEKNQPYQYLAIRHEITKRKKIEEELQEMMKKIIDVQEDERKRLSRNLHDGIGQNLYSHLITINLLQSQMEHTLIDQLQKEATDLIEEVRTISWELRPSVLDDLGLIPAIRSYLSRYAAHYGIDVSFESSLTVRLSMNKEIAIYRIIQESMTNTRKYANSQMASVTIREMEGIVRVMVEDDGKGFNVDKSQRGVGLFSMEERARAVGGEILIDSVIGKGTKIIFELPI